MRKRIMMKCVTDAFSQFNTKVNFASERATIQMHEFGIRTGPASVPISIRMIDADLWKIRGRTSTLRARNSTRTAIAITVDFYTGNISIKVKVTRSGKRNDKLCRTCNMKIRESVCKKYANVNITRVTKLSVPAAPAAPAALTASVTHTVRSPFISMLGRHI